MRDKTDKELADRNVLLALELRQSKIVDLANFKTEYCFTN